MQKIYLMLFTCIVMSDCQKKEEVNHSTQIVALGDITDRQLLLPDPSTILKLFEFYSDENKDAFFRISTISDRVLNPAVEYTLPNNALTEKNNTQDDPNYREKLLVSFCSNVEKALSDFDAKCHIDSSLGKSECFSTIASELQLMKKKRAERNILILFSDVQENSDFFSCYTKANKELLRMSPDKVVARFNKLHLLPNDLKGFEIFFVYQPKNRDDDKKFNVMVTIYRKLLEERGAIVKVQADNNF